MPANRSPSARTRQTIAVLSAVPRVETLGPIAARFIYSLRLIALHERARRDPVPELAARLGRIETAAKALALGHAIAATWPENIHISRFCCCALTHDEATIGALIDAATSRDQAMFDAALEGLVRPARIALLWGAASDLVMAEMHAA